MKHCSRPSSEEYEREEERQSADDQNEYSASRSFHYISTQTAERLKSAIQQTDILERKLSCKRSFERSRGRESRTKSVSQGHQKSRRNFSRAGHFGRTSTCSCCNMRARFPGTLHHIVYTTLGKLDLLPSGARNRTQPAVEF
jgi:hypothetical protein